MNLENCLSFVKTLIFSPDYYSDNPETDHFKMSLDSKKIKNKPVLIGSNALLKNIETNIETNINLINNAELAIQMYRKAEDWDIYIHADDMVEFLEILEKTPSISVVIRKIEIRIPGQLIHILMKLNNDYYEFYVLNNDCTSIHSTLYNLVNSSTSSKKMICSKYNLEMLVADVDVLYIIKKYASYFPVKCLKTKNDVEFMEKNLGCNLLNSLAKYRDFGRRFHQDLQNRFSVRFLQNDWLIDQSIEELPYTVEYILFMSLKIPRSIIKELIQEYLVSSDYQIAVSVPIPKPVEVIPTNEINCEIKLIPANVENARHSRNTIRNSARSTRNLRSCSPEESGYRSINNTHRSLNISNSRTPEPTRLPRSKYRLYDNNCNTSNHPSFQPRNSYNSNFNRQRFGSPDSS